MKALPFFDQNPELAESGDLTLARRIGHRSRIYQFIRSDHGNNFL
jgi:hypothetical protein